MSDDESTPKMREVLLIGGPRDGDRIWLDVRHEYWSVVYERPGDRRKQMKRTYVYVLVLISGPDWRYEDQYFYRDPAMPKEKAIARWKELK